MSTAASPLEVTLKRFSRKGDLYASTGGDALRCVACGHRCIIKEGRAGICKVRYNKDGALFVPYGYVGGLQSDPIEKKPFFHALPGSDALSFGMLGCDYHCGYCFSPETLVFTSEGLISIKEIYERGRVTFALPGGSAGSVQDLFVYSHSGKRTRVEQVFKHPYRGSLVEIKPASVPPIRVTPEHEFLVIPRPESARFAARPKFVNAGAITKEHCLVVPRNFTFSKDIVVDAIEVLGSFESRYKIKRVIRSDTYRFILEKCRKGWTSNEIGHSIGKSGSHVRHLKRKAKQMLDCPESDFMYKPAGLVREAGRVRFQKERRPGIYERIPFTADFAELLGYYAAEGCVVRGKNRVHAATLNFSFGPSEKRLAKRTRILLERVFSVRAYLLRRKTALCVICNKSSLALLFEALSGERGKRKRVPEFMFEAKRGIVEAFIKGYVAGDGTKTPEGQIRITTESELLAHGVSGLVLKLGYLPSVYRYPNRRRRKILGRSVRQSPYTYIVGWYEFSKGRRHIWEDENNHYLQVEQITRKYYKGNVYNLETGDEHTYLAPFAATHNCQNWITSQALRDPRAVAPPEAISAEGIVRLAKQYGARTVASTYNEPLITSEWAVEVFRLAKKEGFTTAYISNGNATPEVLDYIRPWVDLYKIDLKGFNAKRYRALGGVLENVLDSIRRVYEMGFWLEVVTLVIPGFNDSDEELNGIAHFLAGVSADIPWHITAFHKDYKMTDPDHTSVQTLLRAAQIGEQAGLHYVYAGNLPGRVGAYEHTRCPGCKETVIERSGYTILANRLREGRCPRCQYTIAGVWGLGRP